MELGYSWPTKNSFTTNELSIQLDATDLSKQNESKTCRVCGDVARCYHFGGLCCASCKAFFRRAVANDHYKPVSRISEAILNALNLIYVTVSMRFRRIV